MYEIYCFDLHLNEIVTDVVFFSSSPWSLDPEDIELDPEIGTAWDWLNHPPGNIRPALIAVPQGGAKNWIYKQQGKNGRWSWDLK